jgi:hypothetical protein
MGDIRFSVYQSSLTNHLLIIFREVQAPSIEVRRLDIYPVPSSFNLVETGFNEVVHYVDFRDSTDGISLGTLMNQFVYDVKSGTILSERRFYTTDGGGAYDPVSGDDHITDPYLAGKTISGVFKEGFRFLNPAGEYSHTTDTVALGPTIDPLMGGEVIVVEITHLQSSSSGTNNGAGFPNDVMDVTGDVIMDNTYFNNLMSANSSGAVLSITFPDFLTIADKIKFGFNTHNGTQRHLALKVPSSSPYYFQVGQLQKNTIWLGRGEDIVLMKKGNALHVVNWAGDWRRVGDIVYTDREPLNGLIMNSGSWQSVNAYPRLYNEYILNLDPGQLGSGTYPATPTGSNSRKWIIDLVNGGFWVPDLGGHFLRPTDPDGNIDIDRASGDRKPGTMQTDQVGYFLMPVPKGNSFTGGPNNMIFGNGAANPQTIVVPFFVGKETRPINVNKNVYVIT